MSWGHPPSMSPLRDTHRTSASTFETNPSAYGGLSNGHTSSPCTAFRISIDKLMLRVVCSESRSWRVMVEGDDPAAMRPPSTTHNPLPNAWRATGESSSSVCVSSAGSSVFGDTHCPTDCSTVQAKVPVPKPSKAKVGVPMPGVPMPGEGGCPHAKGRCPHATMPPLNCRFSGGRHPSKRPPGHYPFCRLPRYRCYGVEVCIVVQH